MESTVNKLLSCEGGKIIETIEDMMNPHRYRLAAPAGNPVLPPQTPAVPA